MILCPQPVAAQFGVAGKRKKGGSSFEDLNELAKQNQNDGGLGDMMAGLGNFDLDSLAEVMNSPEYQKLVAELGLDDEENMGQAMAQMEEAMKLLSNPAALADAMKGALNALQSDDAMDVILKEKDAILDQISQAGLVSEELIQQYRVDPDKFDRDMKEAMGKMTEVFTDPEALKALQDQFNPENIAKKMSNLDFSSLFADEQQLEEARLGLLDPKNPLSSMFAESEEMKEILRDPVKWKAAMKEGLDLLTNDDGGGIPMKARARVGEEL